MNITKQAAIVLQEIDAELAICEKATIGVWRHDESEMPAGKVKHTEGYLVATCQMRPDATFIAASRTVCPKSLRCLKTAIEGLLKRAVFYPPTEVSHFAETQLTALITQWNENK